MIYRNLILAPVLVSILFAACQVKANPTSISKESQKLSVIAKVKRQLAPNGQLLITEGPPETARKIMQLFREKSDNDLIAAFEALNFNPTQYYDINNPYMNYYLANEVSGNAVKIIEAYQDKLDPNRTDYQGKTALITAAKVYTADEALLSLLKHYKNTLKINAQDKNGCTALHYTAAYGKVDLSSALIKAGADVTLKDKKGRTPLDYSQLSEKELRSILKSIEINPDRDAMALQNYFLYDPNTNNPLTDFPATQDGLEASLNYLQALDLAAKSKSRYSGLMVTFEEKKFPTTLNLHSSTSARNSAISQTPSTNPNLITGAGRNWTAEILNSKAAHARVLQGLENTKKLYTGKSVVKLCLDSQPKVTELLRKVH